MGSVFFSKNTNFIMMNFKRILQEKAVTDDKQVDNIISDGDALAKDFDKKYTTFAKKLQLMIDTCVAAHIESNGIFYEAKKLSQINEALKALGKMTIEEGNKLFTDNTNTNDSIFLIKAATSNYMCIRACKIQDMENKLGNENDLLNDCLSTFHQTSKKLNGQKSDRLATGAAATSIQERLIGACILAALKGIKANTLYTTSEVLVPNYQAIKELQPEENFELFSEDECKDTSKGIDLSWGQMFDKITGGEGKEGIVTTEGTIKEDDFTVNLKDCYCIHPDMPGADNNIQILFGKGLGSSAAKDTVVPADLYFVRKGEKYTEIMDCFKTKSKSLDDLCILTNTLFGTATMHDYVASSEETKNSGAVAKAKISADGGLIPISLKKNIKNPRVYLMINTIKHIPHIAVGDIERININTTGNSSITAVSNDTNFNKHFGHFSSGKEGGQAKAYFEFRWKNTGAKWQCNATVVGAKDALVGGSVKEVAEQVFTSHGKKAETFSKFWGENNIDNISDDDISSLNNSVLKSKLYINGKLIEGQVTRETFVGADEEESSSKAGRCGLLEFLVALSSVSADKSKTDTYQDEFAEIVAKSFKMDPSVQDTVKIM